MYRFEGHGDCESQSSQADGLNYYCIYTKNGPDPDNRQSSCKTLTSVRTAFLMQVFGSGVCRWETPFFEKPLGIFPRPEKRAEPLARRPVRFWQFGFGQIIDV